MGAYQYSRKMREEEVDAEGTWAVSYGDMVTLLLTFFIIFFSIDPTQNKSKEHESDLVLNFGKSVKAKTPHSSSAKENSNPIEKVVLEDVVKKLKGEIVLKGKQVIIEFPEVSFFKSGKIPLTKKGVSVLDEFAKLYSNYMDQYVLVVQAFTDIKKVKQSRSMRFSDNLELSALRGVSTMRVLQKAGIPLRRMRVAGFGEMEETLDSIVQKNNEKLNKKRLLDLARKVVLVIEPEGIK